MAYRLALALGLALTAVSLLFAFLAGLSVPPHHEEAVRVVGAGLVASAGSGPAAVQVLRLAVA